jgi:glycosyltransferase involved in cell wall biosynthesis
MQLLRNFYNIINFFRNQKKDELLVITDYYNSNGGAGVVAHKEIEALSTYGYEFSIYGYRGQFFKLFFDNIKILYIGLFFHRVILVHTWSYFPVIPIISRLGSSKLIFIIHDYLLVCPNKSKYNFKQDKLCELRGGSLKCMSTNCGYSTTKKLYHALITYLLPQRSTNVFFRFLSKRTKEIFHPLDLKFRNTLLSNIDCTPANVTCEISNSSFDQRYLLYVGRNSADKGFDRFEKIQCKYLKVACGPSAINAENSLALGWQSQAVVQDLIYGAAAVIYPSRQLDCDPLVLQFCIKVGTPMYVSTGNAAADKVAEHFGAQFVISNWDDFEPSVSQKFSRSAPSTTTTKDLVAMLTAFTRSKKIKKILHIGKYYHPETGGIETVTKQIYEESALRDYDNVLISFGRQNSIHQDTSGNTIFTSRVNATILKQPLSIDYLLKMARELFRADIIHYHYPNILPLLLLLFVRKSQKLIVHWHSDVVNQKKSAKFLKVLIFRVMRKAQVIIATSNEYAQSSPVLAKLTTKVVVIPLGVPAPQSSTDHEHIHFPELSDKKLAFSLGRLVDYKGYVEFLNNLDVSLLPKDFAFVIAGDGPLYDSLQDIISSRRLFNHVFLLGNISEIQKSWLMHHSSVFFLPSKNRAEAFGIVLIEALSFSLPLVTFRIPGSGVCEINNNPQTGSILKIGEYIAFTKACVDWSASKIDQASTKKHCYKHYSRRFTEKTMVSKVLELYEN